MFSLLFQISHPGQIPEVSDREEMSIGDIILGVPYIYTNCGQNDDELEQILPVLVYCFPNVFSKER